MPFMDDEVRQIIKREVLDFLTEFIAPRVQQLIDDQVSIITEARLHRIVRDEMSSIIGEAVAKCLKTKL